MNGQIRGRDFKEQVSPQDLTESPRVKRTYLCGLI